VDLYFQFLLMIKENYLIVAIIVIVSLDLVLKQ